MLEQALRYAALGWFVFPLHSIRFDKKCGCGSPACTSPGKHPRIKWKAGATCDVETVRGYWTKWPTAGIGCATGPSGLLVFDLDGLKGIETFRALWTSAANSAQEGGADTTGHRAAAPPAIARARTARGVHVFFRGQSPTFSNSKTKLDVRSVGGYVVLAPSPHVSGHVYRWEVEPEAGIAECPPALLAYASAGGGRRRAAGGQGVGGMNGAPHVQEGTNDFTTRLGASLEAPDWGEVERALATIPADCSMDKWIKVGMALHAARDPSGWERWDRWSALGGEKYKGAGEIAYKWTTFKHEVGGVGIGTLFVIAREHGFSRLIVAKGDASAKEVGWKREESTAPETRPPLEEEHAGAALNGHAPALPASFLEASVVFPDLTESKKAKATCANAIVAIKGLGITCEFDEFHERSKVGGHVMSQWAGELSDNLVHRTRILIRECYRFDPGNLHTRDALVQECLCHPFHPIKLYFESLQWDGAERLETWMPRYLGAENDPFNREVSRLSLIAAVRRILQPGCKFDQIIVFDAKEGVGKSTAIEILAGRENFSDQSILDRSEERQQELLQGVWLYEIADLQGHSRAEVEKVKAFASRTTDRARPAYGHFRVDRPRCCILFGTTNPNLYLQSSTGNRRFWPVTTGLVDLDGLRRDRDQLWAEALVAERGASLTLNPKLWEEAAIRQESRRETDPWEDKLSDLKGIKISSRDVIEIQLQIPPAQQSAWMTKRIAHAMRKNGWDGPKPVRDGENVYKGYTREGKSDHKKS